MTDSRPPDPPPPPGEDVPKGWRIDQDAFDAYERGDLRTAHALRRGSTWDDRDRRAESPPYWWKVEDFEAWAMLEKERLDAAAAASREYDHRRGLWKRAAKKLGLRA